MNQQKLNEIAIQAGGIWRGGHVEQLNGDSVYTEQKWVDPVDMDLNKFAELIVRECAKTIEDVHSKDLGEYLKEVFGVKE